MTFLDSSVIIDMLEGVESTVEYVGSQSGPYLTSSICVYEVLEGPLGGDQTDVEAERRRFGGVRSVGFDERLALEAARLQDECIADGQRMAVRDLMIAATASTTSNHLIVADSDFQTDALGSRIRVTNVAKL